jgi:NADPH-dependent ferric siderophore reductase
VTFHGQDLAKFETHGVAEHVKVLFPAAGQERPVLPAWTDEGPVYQPGAERPISRTYTPRRFRPEALELDVEFVVHGEGIASNWAAKAQKGDNVVVTLPGGAYRLDPEARQFVIAGDESAVPAIGQILESLPASARAQVFLEVENAAEEQELTSPAQIDLHWLHRDGKSTSGRLIDSAIHEVTLPEGARVFVACEAGVMRDIRRYLMLERGLPREAFHTHGYWKLGTVNHPDHDLGDD